jgi:hypothetical protein
MLVVLPSSSYDSIYRSIITLVVGRGIRKLGKVPLLNGAACTGLSSYERYFVPSMHCRHGLQESCGSENTGRALKIPSPWSYFQAVLQRA